MSIISVRWLLAMLVVAVLLVAPIPCPAWIYDGGSHVGNGPLLKDGSSTVWAAAAFMLESDAYITKIGTAVARAYGPADAGYAVYLSETLFNIPRSSIERWTLFPTGAVAQYYYANADSPILLKAYTPYYLVVLPTNKALVGTASFSTRGYYGYVTGDYGETWSRAAMPISVRLDGYFVPEPGTATPLMMAMTALFVQRKRRTH